MSARGEVGEKLGDGDGHRPTGADNGYAFVPGARARTRGPGTKASALSGPVYRRRRARQLRTRLFRRHALLVWALLALVATTPTALAQTDDAEHFTLKGEAKARLQNIDQHLDDWDVAGAKVELEELKKVAPPDIEPVRYYQGRIAFEEGRYDDAVSELTAAGVSDKPGSWLRLVKDTQHITKGYLKAESEHFVFMYPKGKDAVLAPYALEALESIRTALLKDLGHAPAGKVRVEVVANAGELAKVSTLTKEQIRTTGTIAICKFSKLMVTSPRALVHGYDWLDTLAHEYIHFVVSQKSRNTVPIWLHEGLAKYLESRWRGPPGKAITPSTLALLGERVHKNTLVPFEKMHPSMALLPTAEDAATAFAEVFFAVDMLYQEHGTPGLQKLLGQMAAGQSDQRAVESVTGAPFTSFEKQWLSWVKKQPFPKELIPRSMAERKELAEGDGKKAETKKKRDVSFGDFAEVEETEARKWAHLGELMRERGRIKAAAEHFGLAHSQVQDRYESVSNKYALTLLELKRYDEAEAVLRKSLEKHPGSGPTSVHLGRILLRKQDWAKARDAYLDAVAVNPFDPEVHLALYRVYEAQGDAAHLERARAALSVLIPNLQVDKISAAAKALAQMENLADAPMPQTSAGEQPAPSAPPTRDAGA